jgi:hypothetical protein
MEAYKNYDSPVVNEDIFSKIVRKETWLHEITLNAIYVKNAIWWNNGSYFIYSYSKRLNTCFINDLNEYNSTDRISVTNSIEQLSTKILPHIKLIQSRTIGKKFAIPKFIYFHNRWFGSSEIIRQCVSLKPLYDNDKNVVGFHKPDWREWNKVLYPEDLEAKKI